MALARAPLRSTEPPTLDQLLRRVRDDQDLTYNNRRRMVAAVNGLIKHAGLDPRKTRATFRNCRDPLNSIEPAAAGITRGHYVNIRTYLRIAFVRYADRFDARAKPIRPDWAKLKARLTTLDRYRRLIRFVRWCNAMRIAPKQVSGRVSAQYLEHLRSETTVRHPERIHQRMCRAWNRMAEVERGWPQVRLKAPTYRRSVALPARSFPPSFLKDLEAWTRRLTSTELVVPDGPRKPLAPMTVKNMAEKILRFASVVIREGVPASELTSLSALVEPQRFRLGIEHFWRRFGRRSTRTQYEVARVIKYMARHWAKPDAAFLLALDQITRRLHTEPIGLGPKVRNVLRQFDDPVNVRKFLALPGKLAAQARRAEGRGARQKAALLMQTAVAIEILMVAPIRCQNLRSLRLGVHFKPARYDGQRTIHLVIPGAEVKNRVPLEFELPQETIDLIAVYARHYLPILNGRDDGFLFPGLVHHKGHNALASQIQTAVRRYAGLQIHVHAFRHIAAKLLLAQRPHDYLQVSLLLGHLSLLTTMKFYCPLERQSAARDYATDVLGRTFRTPSANRRSVGPGPVQALLSQATLLPIMNRDGRHEPKSALSAVLTVWNHLCRPCRLRPPTPSLICLEFRVLAVGREFARASMTRSAKARDCTLRRRAHGRKRAGSTSPERRLLAKPRFARDTIVVAIMARPVPGFAPPRGREPDGPRSIAIGSRREMPQREQRRPRTQDHHGPVEGNACNDGQRGHLGPMVQAAVRGRSIEPTRDRLEVAVQTAQFRFGITAVASAPPVRRSVHRALLISDER